MRPRHSRPMLAVDAGNQYVSAYNSLNQTLSQLMAFRNCTLEVDKFLDRSKLVYEDHKLKRARCERAKETVNSSISSNLLALSSNQHRWRPKGLLVTHSNEHTKEISRISRNFDSSYFATCSPGKIKRLIKRNLTRTY